MNISLDAAKAMTFKELSLTIRENLKKLASEVPSQLHDNESFARLGDLIGILEKKIPSHFLSKPVEPTKPRPSEMPSPPPALNVRLSIENSPFVVESRKKIAALEDGEIRSSATGRASGEREISALKKRLKKRMIEMELKLRSSEWAERYREQQKNWIAFQSQERAYGKELLDYQARMAVWQRLDGNELADYERIVHHHRDAAENLMRMHLEKIARRVPWRILPPGKQLFSHVMDDFDEVCRRNPEREYDRRRLSFVMTLDPNKVHIGEEEFDGYYIFFFHMTERVLLENCEKGNAAYVLFEEWEKLSRLTKQELRDTCRAQHARVCHAEGSNWKGRIRLALEL